ncbi:hypothetical protein G9A89_004194 [Geosiphon pyriformis]|nr:hypothetical protein G9A89_004194 [Geosiphon pyriformis]
MYRRYKILTRRLLAIMLREELTELRFWEAIDKTTIESLFIIQRTQTETFRYKTFRLITLTQITFSTKLRINKEIEHHIQQRYPITYTSKDKKKLQTLVVTSQKIQPPTWKKTRVESPNNPSYHYTPGNAINISSTDMSISNMTSAFRRFPFQSKQKKENLLGSYSEIVSPWEITELKGEQENNLNPEVINQHLPPVIVIDQTPVEPIGQPIQPLNQQNQQPPPVLSKQQQQLLPPQQQQMAYTPIVKLDKFNIKAITANNWDNARAMQAIPYFLQDTADAWYQSLAVKPQNFNGFKTEFLQYFSNNNSINKLANTFTTIRQGDTEAVTIYLELYSSILQRVRPMHPVDLLTAVTYARDFETAELEANYTQAVNLAMNRSSELDSKLKQFSDSINQKLERYLTNNHMIYQFPQ